ncbi:MAG: acyltransferase family protein [Bacteroidetes bacterium]|nr:acyltransferase family protein [Bacteroidota bacterium]
MGILRTILALAVVVYHSNKIFGLRMCGGQVAVEAFYIISGFYMALILNEKYIGPGHYRKFILSRFFRIFPVYWIVLILALMLSLTGYAAFDHPYYIARYISNYDCLSGFTIFYFILENIIVFGQDVLYFLRLDELCQPILTYNVLSFKHAGYQYLLVPQAWTISIECMFYLIAPFLVTRKLKWQLVLVLLGLITKFYFANIHYLCFDPWTYRFFPFEFAFFIAGSIAYRFYKYLQQKPVANIYGYALLIVSVCGIFVYDEIKLPDEPKNSIYYLFILGSIPFIFLAFKDNKMDRYIGELSFSVYISHHLMVSIFRGYFFSNPQYLYLYGYTVVFSSLILAFLLQILVIRKIEIYRQKRFS